MAAFSRALFEVARKDSPGGMARAFWQPVIITSIPSSSFFMGRAEKELTVSTIDITSSNFLTTSMISAILLIVPVEVSLWIIVMASYLPVESSFSTALGSTGVPHSKVSAPASLPQRFETSNHLSENDPLQQFSTAFFVTLRIAPSITPQEELVLRNTGSFV